MPPNLLTFLVADLIRAETGVQQPPPADLLARFRTDPESVIQEYGLGAEARAVLFTMDRQLIGQFMMNELLSTPAPPADDLWGDPFPEVTSVNPVTLSADAGQQLTLMANCVASSAVVHLAAIATFNHFIALPRLDPLPPRLKDQTLIATFDLTRAAPGDYRVLIDHTPRSAPIRASAVVTVKR